MLLTHPFEPLFDERSEILILGTFPSVQSRETEFYYGHPQNRFWKVMAGVFEVPLPTTIAEKRTLLLENRIALWDVLASCEITGSSDASIRNAAPNDIRRVTEHSSIRKVLCNGGKAFELYTRVHESKLIAERMPSTSPANAAVSLDKLINIWGNAIAHY